MGCCLKHETGLGMFQDEPCGDGHPKGVPCSSWEDAKQRHDAALATRGFCGRCGEFKAHFKCDADLVRLGQATEKLAADLLAAEKARDAALSDLKNIAKRFFFLDEAILSRKFADGGLPEQVSFQLRRMHDAFDEAGIKVTHEQED